MDGYFCKKCPEGCDTCFNRTHCHTCLPSYVLLNDLCAACPQNCMNCSNTDNTVCVTCVAGFELQTNQCVPSTNADCLIKDETDSSKCKLCRGSFTINDQGACIRCRAGCSLSCNPRNISECTRNRLQNFFQVTLNDYFFNMEGCMVSINGFCDYPEPGYELVAAADGKIITRPTCLYPCLRCIDASCIACQPGFTFSNGNCNPDLTCNPTCVNCPLGT